MAKATAAVEVHLSPAQKAWRTRQANMANPKPQKVRPKLEPQGKIVLPKPVPTVDPTKMMLRVCIMVLNSGGMGNSRKIKSNEVEVFDTVSEKAMSKDWISVNRKLLEAEEYDAIKSKQNKLKSWIKTRVLPCDLKDGIYLIPKSLTDAVADKLTEIRAEIQPLKEKFAQRLPEYKIVAKKEAGFREDQWPTTQQVLNSFMITWRFLYVDSADGLSKKQAEEERKKAKASAEEQYNMVQLVMRMQMKELVDHLVERLSPNEHGEQKSFHGSSLVRFKDFLSVFSDRNITDDVQLKVLADKAGNLIDKADPELLRTDTEVRDYMLHGFSTIKALLDPMIAKKPHRKISIVD